MRHSSLGIALKLGATLTFSLMYAAVKLAGPVPVGEVIFFRAFFALVPLFALSSFTVGPLNVVRTTRPIFHVLRSIVGVGSIFLNFTALRLLPLADITAFSFVAPIFAVVLAAFMLKEQVGHYRWGAVVAGFTGVLLMMEPHGGMRGILTNSFSPGAAFALGGALCSAFAVVFIRQMSTTERSETIVFYFMLVCSAAGALTMLWDRVPLGFFPAVWLIAAGLMGGIGQICMTFSYRYAEPSLLAPFDYVAMLWAVILGYVLFAEVPERLVMIGAFVVVAAGLLIVWRERKRHRAVAAQAVAPLT